MDGPPKRFADFAEEDAICMDGEKIKIRDIVDAEIMITAYKVKKSRYNKSNSEHCLMLQFLFDGKKRVAFTGSTVLIDQIERYNEHIPFLTTIRQIDKYYTFS